MTKKQENLAYLVLFFIAFALLVYLIVDATSVYKDQVIPVVPENPPEAVANLDDEVENGNTIFEQRDVLFPITTPKPTETKLVLPTPTDTPIPFMEKWELLAIMGNRIMFKDESGKVQHSKQGEMHYDVLIKEVNPKEGYILGRFKDGREKKLKRKGLETYGPPPYEGGDGGG